MDTTGRGGVGGRSLADLSELFLGRPPEPPAAGEPSDLRCLRAVARALAESPALGATLEAALSAVLEAAGGKAARLYLLDAQGLPRLRARSGQLDGVAFLALALRLEGATITRLAHTDQPIAVRESFAVLGAPEVAARSDCHGLALPLSAAGRPLGVMLLLSDAPFGPRAATELAEGAPQLGLIIDYLELLGRKANGGP